MLVELYDTPSGKKHSDSIPIGNERFIKFTENDKGEIPKFSVKTARADKEMSFGSVLREEIDMTYKALDALSTAYSNDIIFLFKSEVISQWQFDN